MKNYSILENLPLDTGGIHKAFPLGSIDAYYGYYAYTPSVYYKNGPKYPLLLFLHGAGERGNSASDGNILDIVLRNGPPMLIKKKIWTPKYPLVVISPQAHEGGWNGAKIHQFIKHIINNYEIDAQRIYITGLSMGAYGTFNYLTSTGDSCYAAAAVAICGGGNPTKASAMKHIPVWAFHGDADGTVNIENSISMIDAINKTNPPQKAKLTVYPGVGHNSWSMTYDGTGMGKESNLYDPFNIGIYEWMFLYERNQF